MPNTVASLRLMAAGCHSSSAFSTWTLSRETDYKLNFAGVLYYDGQGFMLRKALNINSALDLDGKKVCFQSGTTTGLNLKDFFTTNNMKFEEIALPTAAESYNTRCCPIFISARPVEGAR